MALESGEGRPAKNDCEERLAKDYLRRTTCEGLPAKDYLRRTPVNNVCEERPARSDLLRTLCSKRPAHNALLKTPCSKRPARNSLRGSVSHSTAGLFAHPLSHRTKRTSPPIPPPNNSLPWRRSRRGSSSWAAVTAGSGCIRSPVRLQLSAPTATRTLLKRS